MKPAALLKAAPWRGPGGRKLRKASGQLSVRNWGPQTNSSHGTQSCQQPQTWAWKWLLPQLSLQIRLQPWLTVWLQTASDLKAAVEHWDTLLYKSQKHTADWKTGAISQATPEKQPINPLGASWDLLSSPAKGEVPTSRSHPVPWIHIPSTQLVTPKCTHPAMTESWPAETEIINVYCLKLLSFGVIYYIAIDN